MAKLLNPRDYYKFENIICPENQIIDDNFISWIQNILKEEFNIITDVEDTKFIENDFVSAVDDLVSVVCLTTGTMFLYYKEWVEIDGNPKFLLQKRKFWFDKAFVIQWKNTREIDYVEYCHQKNK